MATAQFISVGAAELVRGKKQKTQIINKTMMEIVSQMGVNFPMLQRAGGRGWPRQRRRRTQEMEMI